MTDTGQVPGEGLPESAGTVEQPGVPTHGSYTYLSEATAQDEDLLLLPGAQSPWGNEVAPPAPEPVVEAVHQPGPHETAGRDSGSVDLSGVRLPDAGQALSPPSTPLPPRRPLHLGPPVPNTSASPVRSLADRGPADAPLRHTGPPTTGPEYLDVPAQAAPARPAHPDPAPTPAETVVPTSTAPARPTATSTQAHEPHGTPTALLSDVPDATPPGAGVAYAPTPGFASAQTSAPSAPVPEPYGTFAETAAPESMTGATGSGAPTPTTAAQPDDAPPTEITQTDAPEASAAEDDRAPAEDDRAPQASAAEGDWPSGTSAPGASAAEGEQPAGATAPQATQAGEADASEQPREQGPVAPGDASVPEAAETGNPPAPEVSAAEQLRASETARGEAPASEATIPEQAPAFLASALEQTPVSEATAPAQHPAHPPTAPEGTQGCEATHFPEPGTPDDVQRFETAEDAHAADAVADTSATPDAAEAAHPVEQAVTASATSEAAPSAAAEADPEPAVQPIGDTVAVAGNTPAAGTVIPVPQVAEGQDGQSLHNAHVRAASRITEAAELQPTQDPVTATHPHAEHAAAPAPHTAQDQPPQDPQGPQSSLAGEPGQPDPQVASALADVAHQAEATAAGAPGALPGTVPLEPAPDQPLNRFVPVDGTVPTTPHLAPTPPHAITLPAEVTETAEAVATAAEVADVTGEPPQATPTVPAPREAEPPQADAELLQHADDLATHAAAQEDQEAQEARETQNLLEAQEVLEEQGPAAPGYDDAEREAVLKVMRERRDIRNGFRCDPIPHEVLLRVLEAAHTAPSVGHSQPWDFVVIRSADTRRAMHELANRQRDAYAKSLPKGRAKQFKELKIEAILDTPVNIVVTADPTRGGRHTLGRHTQPQMAPYSSALAVENLWLAARAEGLGVGWVSFFDEREMVRALGLPEHLEVVAYLCVGYVDEFPDEPELMQAGWSKRRPLSWVVHEETYGRRALPGEEPHDLLAETVAQIRPLDAKALGEAWERQKRMTKPPGALGMLEIISAQLCGLSRQCPPPIPEPAAVAVFAGDHGVHAQGVTPWPQEVTGQMVANFLGGGAVCNAFANQVGAEVCVVDVGVVADLPATPGLLPRKIRAGTSDMTTGPAMTREEAKQAIEVGIETARDLVAAGNKALLTGEMGIANTTASAALISVFTGADPAEVTGRGTGINDETLARKTEVVRRALELHRPDPADPVGVLAAIGGFEHAAIVGLLLGGASLRTPVILDGVSAGAAALVARAIAPEALAACIAGHRSAEPGHVAALNKLGLRPLVDLDLRLGEGTGALLALPLVQSTARAMHEVATFDSAGVTEK